MDQQSISQQVSSEDDHSQITVVIEETQRIKDGLTDYITYTISGSDKNGEFRIQRRFNDFKDLRSVMQHRWPACYVPPLPAERVIGNMDARFINDRMDQLQQFCNILSQLKHLWYSEEFNLFLRGQDFKEKLGLLKQTKDDLTRKYKAVFSKIIQYPIDLKILDRLQKGRRMVDSIMPMMENFKKINHNICQARQQSAVFYNQLFNTLLSQYEVNVFQEYIYAQDEKLIFSPDQMEQKVDYKEQLDKFIKAFESQEIYAFHDVLSSQIKELQVLKETFELLDNYKAELDQLEVITQNAQLKVQRIMGGKVGITNIFKNKAELQTKAIKELQEAEAQKANVENIYNILIKILGYSELDRFEGTKLKEYYSSLKTIATFEIRLAQLRGQFYELLLQNPNLLPGAKRGRQQDLSEEVQEYIEQRMSSRNKDELPQIEEAKEDENQA